MNYNELINEIENRILLANEFLPVIVDELKIHFGDNIIYRIKNKERILDKLHRWSSMTGYKAISPLTALNSVRDIIGITVIVDKLEEACGVADEIIEHFENKTEPIEFDLKRNYIDELTSITGYKFIVLGTLNRGFIPFEIQITDMENLSIRDATHSEFVKKKYES